MDNARFVRTSGLWCIVGGLITAVGGGVTASITSSIPTDNISAPYTPNVFIATQICWAISHALIFLGTLGFARADAVGTARLGRIGLGIALVGTAAIVPGQLSFIFAANETETSTPGLILSTAIGLATLTAALGYLLAGVAVLQAGRWQGWHCVIPLLCGLLPFVGLLPALAVAPDYFLWPLAAWSAAFALLGLALAQQPALPQRAPLSAATA